MARTILLLMSLLLTTAICLVLAEATYFASNGMLYASAWNESQSQDNPEQTFRRVPADPAAQHYRIITLGGSTTYGMGLEEIQTWPYLLSERLREQTGEPQAVLNLGYLGGHLEQIRANVSAISTRRITRYDWIASPLDRPRPSDLLDFGIGDLETDIIILTPIVNDTVPDFFMSDHWSDAFCRSMRGGAVTHHFAATHYICQASLVLRSSAAPRDEDRLPDILDGFRARLRRVAEELLERDAKLVLMSLPMLFRDGDSAAEAKRAASYWGQPDRIEALTEQARYYPQILRMEEDVIGEVAQQYELHYLRLYDLFSDLSFRKRMQLYDDAVHVNAEGAARIAEAILADLQHRNL